MAFTKIQPQQLQLPTFTSPSGDLSFSDLSTGIEINLSRNISGPININDLTVDSSEVLKLPSSSSVSSTSVVLAGPNNTVGGTYNVVINGSSNSEISGSYNVLVNGTQVDFGASGQNNTIIGGDGVSFADQVTGAVILADYLSSVNNNTNHSLLISFNSGVTFQNGDVTFEDPVTMGQSKFLGSVDMHDDLSVTGNLGVTGNIEVVGESNFKDAVTFVESPIFNSGIDLTLASSAEMTLPDGSFAASQYWVNRIGSRFKIDNSYPSDLSSYLNTAYGNSFGTNSTDEVLNTGQAVTGLLLVDTVANPDEAKLVFVTESFTGVIDFTQFQYVT